jgi:uncharacterized YkwD family protein/spore coat assembly protein SafA
LPYSGSDNAAGSGSTINGADGSNGPLNSYDGSPYSGAAGNYSGGSGAGSGSGTGNYSGGYGVQPGSGAPFSGSPTGGLGSGLPAIGGARADDPYSSTPDVKPDPVNGQRGYREAGAYNPGHDRPLLKAKAIPGKTDVYYVNRGDSLWKISRRYMIDLEELISGNPALEDPDLIYPGDQISVPLNSESSGGASGNGAAGGSGSNGSGADNSGGLSGDNSSAGASNSNAGASGANRAGDSSDIAAANTDKGDGSTKIRSNIIAGRYSGTLQEKIAQAEEEDLFELVNRERENSGLKPFNISKELSNISRIKADEMSCSKYFDHTSPVYGSPFEMLRSFGVAYRTAGENIAKGQKTAKSVLAAWMGSEGHKANILNEKFTDIGIGYASNGKTAYWVQIFIGN